MTGSELADARAAVEEGHGLVRGGRYVEALRRFTEAGPVLLDTLGEEHEEVRALREDIDTVRQMAGMWTLGREMGLGWRRDDEPEPAGGPVIARPRGGDER